MTAPASESCGFCICCISSFIPPQVKRQSENVRFSSLSRCCNWSTGHGGAVPAWKIKPACPRWLPPNKIHSFAFPCCNLALLSHTYTLSLPLLSLSLSLSLIPASFQPRSLQFRRDLNVGGEERKGGKENKGEEAVLTQGCYLDRRWGGGGSCGYLCVCIHAWGVIYPGCHCHGRCFPVDKPGPPK